MPEPRGWIFMALALLVLGVAMMLAHFLFFRYSFPPVNVDEASFFSPAYDLAVKGVLSSDVHAGFLPGAGEHTYWMPPFYMVFLSFFLKLTGTTVFNAKLLSLIITGLSALVLFRMFSNRYARVMVTALFLVCPFVIITSAYVRMEALGLLLILLSADSVRRGSAPWIRGVLAGLLFMTHPMLLPASAGLLLIAAREGGRPLLIFLLTALLVITPYLLYIFQDPAVFRLQMELQFARKSERSGSLEASYLLQLLPLLLTGWICLYKTRGWLNLRLFLAVSMTLTALLALKSNEFNYHVYLVPFLLVSLGLLIEGRRSAAYRFALPFSLYGFFLCLVFLKASKYDFRTDADYRQVISFLNAHPHWMNKRIYVEGNPDVAAFLIMEGQRVERKNAVASAGHPGWQHQYDCVITVSGDTSIKPQQEPWHSWKEYPFISSGKTIILKMFVR